MDSFSPVSSDLPATTTTAPSSLFPSRILRLLAELQEPPRDRFQGRANQHRRQPQPKGLEKASHLCSSFKSRTSRFARFPLDALPLSNFVLSASLWTYLYD